MSGIPNIKPAGVAQQDIVDAMNMAFRSLYGICAKLDADGGVPLETYVANCWTALINVVIEDSKGNRTGQSIADTSSVEPTHIITPNGLSEAALLAAIYQFTNAWETLTEQLDTDVLTDSTYEALGYTATMLYQVENQKGNILGNGTAFYFRPGMGIPYKELVDMLYDWFKSIDTVAAQLDNDGTVTDVNYEALWYTAVCTLMVENSQASTIGIAR
jgi:hypothetical protein